jgi:hypothetical protein
MLLDYLSTHPNATICYHTSNMVLAVFSDAAYLSLPNARSHAAGYFFLTNLPSATSSPPNPKLNGSIHVLCRTNCTVAASASEAKTSSLFLNAQEAVPVELTTVSQNDSLLLQKAVNCMDRTITSNTYYNHNYQSMILNCTQLTKLQQDELLSLFSKYSSLFDGTLGRIPNVNVHLELKPGAKPYCARAHKIPHHITAIA